MKVAGIEDGKIRLVGEAVFFNPNHKGLKLRNGEIHVRLDGKDAGTVVPSDKVRIQPNSEFTIPLEAFVETRGSGFLGNILGALGGKTFHVEYEGYIRVSRGLLFSRIKIRDETNIRF